MPQQHSNKLISSFMNGEISPRLYNRVDLKAYTSSLALCRNFIVDFRGGITSRPGTIPMSSLATSGTIIPYVYSTDVEYGVLVVPGSVFLLSGAGFVLPSPLVNLNLTINGDGVTFSGGGVTTGDILYFAAAGLYRRAVSSTQLDYPIGITGAVVANPVLRLSAPYTANDLTRLAYAQDASTLVITHLDGAYAPYLLEPTALSWTFTAYAVAAVPPKPTGLSGSVTAGGGMNYSYVVTAVIDGLEGPASDPVYFSGSDISASAGTITLSWTAVTDADSYRVYKATPSLAGAVPAGVAYGYVGRVFGTAFVDNNISPDFTATPPLFDLTPFDTEHPGIVDFYQQRMVFAGTTSKPHTLWFSSPGFYKVFRYSDPPLADDRIEATLTGKQVARIRGLLPIRNQLLTFTSNIIWSVAGTGTQSAISATSIDREPQSDTGIYDKQPIQVNNAIIYPSYDGKSVYGIEYDFYRQSYIPRDLSVLSTHLLYTDKIIDWAYQQRPHKVMWFTMESGRLLSLTYHKDQEINGWAQHITDGVFTSVGSTQEHTWAIVRRDGQHWLELFAERDQPHPRFVQCVDQGAIVNLPSLAVSVTGLSGTTMSFSGSHGLSVGDYVVTHYGGEFEVTGVPSTASATVAQWNADPVLALGGTVTARGGPTFSQLSGLQHLAGVAVTGVLWHRGAHTTFTATVPASGTVTLPSAATTAQVGRSFTPVGRTLPLDTQQQQPTTSGRRKRAANIMVRTADSVGRLNIAGTTKPLSTVNTRFLLNSGFTDDAQVEFSVLDPLPCTIVGLTPDIFVGDGP